MDPHELVKAAMAAANFAPLPVDETLEKEAMPLARLVGGGLRALGRGLMTGGRAMAPANAAAVRGSLGAQQGFGLARTGIPGWLAAAGSGLLRRGVGLTHKARQAAGSAATNAAMNAGKYTWGPLGTLNKFLDTRTGWQKALTWAPRMIVPRTNRGAAGLGLATTAIADRANEGSRMRDVGNYATARTLQELRGKPGLALGAAFGGPETVARRLAEQGYDGAARHYWNMNQSRDYADQYAKSLARQAYIPGLSSIY